MNIKSLLLGSAAAAVAFSGAQAADAIIIAEPEPMEYVRICDTYGTGFFYIPGTENCLKIGGYVRYEMRYRDRDFDGVDRDGGGNIGVIADDDNFDKFARFAVNFDARTATEWGTLRSYAQIFSNWSSGALSGSSGTTLDQAFISLENGPHLFLVGKTDTPFHATSIGGLNQGGLFDTKGNNSNFNDTSTGIVSYTFNAGNGLSFTAGVIENVGNTDFEPNLEGVIRYSQGWGVLVAAVGYDNVADEWGGKIAAEVRFNPITLGLQLQYGSAENSAYGAKFADGVFSKGDYFAGATSEWSVSAYARAAVTNTLSAKLSVQWFDGVNAYDVDPTIPVALGAYDDAWQIAAGLDWQPVSGLAIVPEVRYTKADIIGAGSDEAWEARLRFQRSF